MHLTWSIRLREAAGRLWAGDKRPARTSQGPAWSSGSARGGGLCRGGRAAGVMIGKTGTRGAGGGEAVRPRLEKGRGCAGGSGQGQCGGLEGRKGQSRQGVAGARWGGDDDDDDDRGPPGRYGAGWRGRLPGSAPSPRCPGCWPHRPGWARWGRRISSGCCGSAPTG